VNCRYRRAADPRLSAKHLSFGEGFPQNHHRLRRAGTRNGNAKEPPLMTEHRSGNLSHYERANLKLWRFAADGTPGHGRIANSHRQQTCGKIVCRSSTEQTFIGLIGCPPLTVDCCRRVQTIGVYPRIVRDADGAARALAFVAAGLESL